MRKNYLLWFALLAIILLGCRQEINSLDDESSNRPDVYVTHKSSVEFSKNLKLTGKLATTLERLNETSLASKSSDTIYNINMDNALYLEDKNTNRHSYIFKTQNQDPLSFDIKNLVLASSQSGDYRAYMVTYTLTKEERKLLDAKGKLDLNGKTTIEPLDMESISLNNRSGSCWDLFTYQEDCDCHSTHAEGGCTHPTTVYELVQVNCSGGGEGTGTPPPPPGDNGPGNGGGGNPGNGGGGILVTPDGDFPSQDPCFLAAPATSNLNQIMKDQNINPKLQALKNLAASSNVEYGVTVSSNSNGYYATNPYTDNNPSSIGIKPPDNGSFLASAHSHPDVPPPSITDLYSAIQASVNYFSFKGGLVYAKNGAVFALVVTNTQQAQVFLTTYPKDINWDSGTKLFNEETQLGKDFNEIYNSIKGGTYPNYSGNDQNDALETSLAYILEKYNAGINLAKKDSSGNLKPVKAVSFEYIIPYSGGKKVTAYKTEMCP